MSRESNYKSDDFQRLNADNQFLYDQHEKLQHKYMALKKEADGQKGFYEKALEQRFNQMEQLEDDCAQLRQKVDEFETIAEDRRIKMEMAQRDKEDLKKKLDAKDRENLQGTQKEEELLAKIDELQRVIKEKD